MNGVATFSSLNIQKTGSFTLSVTDGSLTSDTTASFAITPAAASKLTITSQPANTVAGVTMSSIVVQVRDQYDNVVTTDASNVTIAIASGSGTLVGTTTVAASSGVATFSTLSLTSSGNYTLSVTDGGLTSATSTSFTISPDAAHHLGFTTAPASGTAGSLSTIVAKVLDQYGNVVTSDTSAVTISKASGIRFAHRHHDGQCRRGCCDFSGLQIQTSGAYTLSVADGSLTGATSSSITISAAAASQVVFTQQPADAIAGGTAFDDQRRD